MPRSSSSGSCRAWAGAADLRAGAVVVALALVASGCRSPGRPSAPTTPPPGAELPHPAAGLVAGDLATQRLFRLEVKGPEGRSSLRLALRLWRADRFDVVASDAFGRSLWVLEVAGAEGRVRAPREHRACRFDSATPIALPGLDLSLPPDALPAVLLGRLPAPEPVRELVRAGARDPLLDPASGDLWRVVVEAGRLAGWSVERAGGTRFEWSLDGRGSRLTVGDALEIEWREVARESLDRPPPAWGTEAPTEICRDAAGS